MAVPFKSHTVTIGGTSYRGFAEPYTPKADETPPGEGLTVLAYWLVLIDPLADYKAAGVVPDAAITDIYQGSILQEAGPLYIREVKPYYSGLSSDHIEIRAVAYREES